MIYSLGLFVGFKVMLMTTAFHDSQTQAIKHKLKLITNEFGPAREMDVLAARAADGARPQMTDVERVGGYPTACRVRGSRRRGKCSQFAVMNEQPLHR